MKVSRSDLCNIIQNLLLESKQNGQAALYNTELYRKVKEKTGRKISHRDYNAALYGMVGEDILEKTDKRGSKVFYSLTENAVREYQHNLLGIDKEKERLRLLYQLLFFYEVAKYGEKSFIGEKDYRRFLESIGLSLQDLKPSRTVEVPEVGGRLIYFEHINGIVIVKHEPIQENITACYYYVTLPGFTQQEILHYYYKSMTNDRRVMFYHSHHFLNMFGHIEFRRHELKTAFSQLKRALLIKQISLTPGASGSDIPHDLRRYSIANEKVRELITEVWKLYQDIHTFLYMKSSIEELDKLEILWLKRLFGDSAAEKMLKNWRIRHKQNQKYLEKKDKNYRGSRIYIERKSIEREKTKASYLKLSSDIKEKVLHLNEKYKHVMQEYAFPLNLITEILRLQ